MMDSEYDSMYSETGIGDEPPDFSIGAIISSFRTRGLLATMDDEALGPHVHLFLLLTIVLFLSIIIGISQFAF